MVWVVHYSQFLVSNTFHDSSWAETRDFLGIEVHHNKTQVSRSPRAPAECLFFSGPLLRLWNMMSSVSSSHHLKYNQVEESWAFTRTYIYIYVRIYVYMYILICMYIWILIFICIYYIHVYIYMYIFKYVYNMYIYTSYMCGWTPIFWTVESSTVWSTVDISSNINRSWGPRMMVISCQGSNPVASSLEWCILVFWSLLPGIHDIPQAINLCLYTWIWQSTWIPAISGIQNHQVTIWMWSAL